jgi:DNA invertase Pin-like site-specific DNA recombinase
MSVSPGTQGDTLMSAKRLAVSYSRFSSPKQLAGDSAERQADLFRSFCDRHKLKPHAEVYADKGKSGYSGKHLEKGRLGQLIAAAEEGRFAKGTVIVVEAWDRLGRLRPDQMTTLVSQLLKTGVSIGVCRLDDVFTLEDFGTHKWTTLAVFVQLAYQESKQKADRISAVWKRRRERAREEGEPMAQRLPAWLERVNGVVRVIPERAAAVRRIFQLAGAGYGNVRIIRQLV